MFEIKAIFAASTNGVIGSSGKLPWRVPEDLRYFKEVTAGSTVLMGMKTWDSLPEAVKPLEGRVNVVLTRCPEKAAQLMRAHEDVVVIHDLKAYLRACLKTRYCGGPKVIWVMGGREIYDLTMPYVTEIRVTNVHIKVDGDTRAPSIDTWKFEQTHITPLKTSKSGLQYSHSTYRRREKGMLRNEIQNLILRKN